MGKLEHELVIKHFSHEHPLQLINRKNGPSVLDTETAPCAGCNLMVSGWVYGCQACDYYLDITCSQLPRRISHGAHAAHTLSLHASPVYPEGSFDCDACGDKGTGFCFHCDDCELDLHVTCVAKPLRVKHGGHSQPLALTVSSPYGKGGFLCDVCSRPGSNLLWFYRCYGCEFDAHMCCVSRNPGMVAVATRTQQQQQQGFGHHRPQQRGLGHTCHPEPAPEGKAGLGNGLVEAVAQGFLSAVSQQVGQDPVQAILGGGPAGSSAADVASAAILASLVP